MSQDGTPDQTTKNTILAQTNLVMDQPSTSARKKRPCNKPIAEAFGVQTSNLVNRIRLKLKEEQATINMISFSDPVGRAARYTGMHRTNIEKILALGDLLQYEFEDIDRQLIHKELVSTYLCNSHIPSLTEFYDALHEKLPIYIDINYFSKILIKMGYVFHKFTGSNTLRVMEKKSVTFERYKYLKSIQRYRKEKVPIVYIGFAAMNNEAQVINLERTLKTDPHKIRKYILFTATDHDINHIKVYLGASKENMRNIIKDWLLKILSSHDLSPRTVCIFEDSKIYKETVIEVPTYKSVKADMVEWLEEHNIPCRIDMPKSDLLDLIETCTDVKKNTYVIDNLFKIHNYSMLRLPQCINGLSIASLVVKYLNNEETLKAFGGPVNTQKTLSMIPERLLKTFSKCIQTEERQQLEDDIQVDDALDELVRKMKTSESVIDLESEDDLLLLNASDSD